MARDLKGRIGAGSLMTEKGNPHEASWVAEGADAVTGHLDGIDAEGRLLFSAEGAEGRVPVAIGVELPDDVLVRAANLGRRALVIRTNEDRPRWVLVGLVRERVATEGREEDPDRIHATVDGDTVELTGEREIELRCGKARITLREDGRIEVSGTYLLNRSRGPLKLKGATVEIN